MFSMKAYVSTADPPCSICRGRRRVPPEEAATFRMLGYNGVLELRKGRDL